MEKFGIFNLLSSLFAVPKETGERNSAENKGDLPPFKADDYETANAANRATKAPLKNSMLATMKNHDEFVKRVRAQNKQNKR